MVQVLLGQGAELNAKDKNGWLSLHYAAKSGFLSTVKLLVDNGSPTTSQTLEGYIPLWYAPSYCTVDIADISYLFKDFVRC